MGGGDISTQVCEPRAQTPQVLSPQKWQHLHWPCPTLQARRRECSWREYTESLVTGGGQWQVPSPGKSGLCSCIEWETGRQETGPPKPRTVCLNLPCVVIP